MSRLNLFNLPIDYNVGQIAPMFRDIQEQVNALSEGYILAHHTAKTSAPTVGNWKQGDYIKNTAVSELGVALSKYVVLGWVCTASGTPGTWLQCRALTGN
jgi:hypothetical protein